MPDLTAGIVLFTHHKYRKRLESDVALDPQGQPLDPEDEAELGQESIALRDDYGLASDRHTDSGAGVVSPHYWLPVHRILTRSDAARTTFTDK